MKQKYYWIFAIIALLGIVFINNYFQKPINRIGESGFLQGKITIGPLCPVERIPPEPSCQPTEETYKAWQVVIYASGKKTKIAQIEPSLDGTYKIELPVGDYVVDFEKQHAFARNLPETVTIKNGETEVLNINIDTLIR